LTGVGVIVTCTLLGLAYRDLHARGRVGLGIRQLLVFGALTHAVLAAGIYFMLPADVAMELILQFAPVVMLVFPPATLMLGLILKDANDRIETERSLRSASGRLRAIGNAIPDLLFVLDEDGRYVEILSGSATQLHAKADELRGRLMHEVLPKADADLFLAHVHSTLAAQATQTFEYDLPTRTGVVRHFEARLYPLEPLPGRRRAVVLLSRDITERHESQKRLQASEARFRDLLQNIPSMAVQGYAPDGTTVYWNAASERLYGYSAQEALGRNLLDLIVPESLREEAQGVIREMRVTGKAPAASELLLRDKNGGQVPVYSSHAIVDQGDDSKVLFCFDIDLSERKRTESELRIAAIAFEAQEGMMVADAKHAILRVNQAFTQITGFESKDVLGKTPDILSSGWHDEKFFAAMASELARSGRWEGEVWSRRKDGEIYPQWLNITAVMDMGGNVTNYVATFVDITHRKAAEDQIRRLAFYDSLTGLPNRRLLMDRLNHAMATSARSGQHGALLFIDLDHFKTLNDTMGHDKGDLLLQQVGQRLMETVREEDTVARLGGDEFVVMLEGLGKTPVEAAAKATSLGEKVISVLNSAYQLAGAEYHSTPSIGVALFSGNDVVIDDLLKHADLAMYQAKNAGRNGMRFFDPQMQASVSQRAALEKDIRRGILLGQFLLFYQPQVNAGGDVVGAEALLRWAHPERGMVSPADFIPVAEESGHILSLGSWVLEAACAQLLVWASDPVTEHLTLAVNVSARQFRQPDFADYVLGLLDYTGANPLRLKLELTESLLADNLEDVIVKMEALRARGVGFSLDDFGTGYSSLSYLKRLPLDQLKIDQSFVADVLTDPNDASIAQTIVALGRGLGLAVIAEGVETEAQRNFLLQAGCETYQGYLFSKPIPADQFERYIKAVRPQ
jgi:diguanylate cyclase (GGDEF)-like protein/PAS domain S-box-containing protein